jgi:hypothetical protein
MELPTEDAVSKLSILFVVDAALDNQGHRRQSIHLERFRRRRTEINHPPTYEGTPVIDPHNPSDRYCD